MEPKNQKQFKNPLVAVKYFETSKEQPHEKTFMDGYRNILGRVQKIYNKDEKRYEYHVFDHEDKPMFEKVFFKEWEVDQAFLQNKDALLKAAHQRRIEAKKARTETERAHGEAIEGPYSEFNEQKMRQDEVASIRQSKSAPEKGQGITR